jgi:hypothetical protein
MFWEAVNKEAQKIGLQPQHDEGNTWSIQLPEGKDEVKGFKKSAGVWVSLV